MYQWLVTLFSEVGKRFKIKLCMCGLGLAYSHVDLLYLFGSGRYADNLLVSDIISAGFFVLLAFIVFRKGHLGRSSLILVGAMLLSSAGVVLLGLSHGRELGFIGSFFMAAGFTAIYLLWLELYGCLKPVQVAMAIAASSAVHVIIQLTLGSMGFVPRLVAGAILPLLSVLAYVHASSLLSVTDLPRKVAGQRVPAFALLAVWVLLFGLVTGLGRDAEGSDLGETLSLVGRLIPALALMLGILLFPRRFDLKLLYQVAAPVMLIGLIMMLSRGQESILSELVISVGSDTCNLLMVIIGCGIAYITRSSGMFWAGLLIGVECAGFASGSLLREASMPLYVNFFIMMFLAVGFVVVTIYLFREESLLAQGVMLGRILDIHHSQAMDVQGFVERSIADYGLSPAESTVLTMIAQGSSREEISSELFIAPVTVRVHISRICKKMSLDSSDDLNVFIQKQHLR